ncbi:alpha/beta fold hydrolase [Phenylobacterium sp.]|uniref:alpha/beta fold hydrolase n=1 Tax=Phenylobacterium sp. TaxID=1871053 RepID=UPI00260B0508|nr:alpha/beta fold hydrolase [Phenylobacterium sp.]
MTEPQTTRFQSFDGVEIAVHTAGAGRPVVLLHGFFSSGRQNWFLPGHAERLVAAGFQVIAPDLRGHGESGAPVEAEAWPQDVLARDQAALIAHLGLSDFDLVGYSLGARTSVRAVIGGLSPRRMALGGMGASGVMAAGARAAMFEDSIRNGANAKDPRAGKFIQALMAEMGLNPQAMLGVLAAFQETTEDQIRAIKVPTLVVCGEADRDNGSPHELVDLLPHGELVIVPGDHRAAAATPELGEAVVGFLTR